MHDERQIFTGRVGLHDVRLSPTIYYLFPVVHHRTWVDVQLDVIPGTECSGREVIPQTFIHVIILDWLLNHCRGQMSSEQQRNNHKSNKSGPPSTSRDHMGIYI